MVHEEADPIVLAAVASPKNERTLAALTDWCEEHDETQIVERLRENPGDLLRQVWKEADRLGMVPSLFILKAVVLFVPYARIASSPASEDASSIEEIIRRAQQTPRPWRTVPDTFPGLDEADRGMRGVSEWRRKRMAAEQLWMIQRAAAESLRLAALTSKKARSNGEE